VRTLRPPLPAVTCTAQSTMLTGLAPSEHGIVGNGWHDRSLGEVQFWKQSNRLVAGEKVWETARRVDPSFTCANACWWYAMHASSDAMLTPRPIYKADGRKIPDCLTKPADLRDTLQARFGQFPLFKYWGPTAGIESTDWISMATKHFIEETKSTLVLSYLPHLDYALQKLGPGHPSIRSELREIDRVVGGLLDICERARVLPLIVSEYGIVPVRDAVWLNRVLRDAGLLAVRLEDGREIVGRLDWHIDLHYTGKPNRGALLRAVVCATDDGMTGFGDLAKAWDALDAPTQALLERLEVTYTFSMQRRHMRFVDLEGYQPGPWSPKKPADVRFPNFPEVAYPAVLSHPVTGRKILGIVEQFLERIVAPHRAGLCNDEAIELLERLVAHTRKPEFHYFHRWEPGDMILWDNWRAMHCATGTAPGVKRLIHRTTIMGEAALGRVIES